MLDTANPTETANVLHMPRTGRRETADRPRLMSLERVRRELGDIGKTKLYEIVHEKGLRLVKVGGRTVIPSEDVDRVVDDILAAAPASTPTKAKAMALKSVEARRQSPAPPARRRRGTDPTP